MEEVMTIIGTIFGFLVGIIIGITIFEQPKMSGSYLTYRNEIYKQVPKEELDNIIILEVK